MTSCGCHLHGTEAVSLRVSLAPRGAQHSLRCSVLALGDCKCSEPLWLHVEMGEQRKGIDSPGS